MSLIANAEIGWVAYFGRRFDEESRTAAERWRWIRRFSLH